MPPRKQARNASAHKKRNRHRSKSQSADPYVTGKGKDGSCPIVGIGGSAGGFEAAMELLRHLPARTGMAFVIVQHLDPHHGSRLANLLGKATSMPRSAIRSGFVDLVLSPDAIARELGRIAEHPYIRRPLADAEQVEKEAYRQADDLGRVFLSLKKQMGVDFSGYKETTLIRRVNRRMALHRIETLSQYARHLRNNKKEIEALLDDVLMNVTRFFRDEALFRALKKRFLPTLLRNKKKERQRELRVWVPGCATGEEVYSLAICILEVLGNQLSKIRVQIFGTDLSESVIEHARAGIYPGAIEKDVPRARLNRFFVKRDGSYQIHRSVRDICTFARQNLTADPPFSRLDLISCRNVLIYLSSELHKRCIPQFHYALNPGGYLIF